MNSFTEKGLTKQINLNEGKARYEISRNDNHHHLICQNCGSIEDISDCPIDALEKEIQEKKNLLSKLTRLSFWSMQELSVLENILLFTIIGSVGGLTGGLILLFNEKFAIKISISWHHLLQEYFWELHFRSSPEAA